MTIVIAPHIGHLHSMVIADVLKRWQLLKGRHALLCTGTDEHGLKVESADFCIRYDLTEGRSKELLHEQGVIPRCSAMTAWRCSRCGRLVQAAPNAQRLSFEVVSKQGSHIKRFFCADNRPRSSRRSGVCLGRFYRQIATQYKY